MMASISTPWRRLATQTRVGARAYADIEAPCQRSRHASLPPRRRRAVAMFQFGFSFGALTPLARWNAKRQAVEFGVEIGAAASCGSRGECLSACFLSGKFVDQPWVERADN